MLTGAQAASDLAHGEGFELVRRVLDRLRTEAQVSRDMINLVPSENRLSPTASAPLRYDFYNRYFFNPTLDSRQWFFRGAQGVGDIETTVAVPVLRQLARAQHVNVRPISGMSAMTLVLLALGGSTGESVISIKQSCGGHYATSSMIARVGRRPLTVGQEQGRIAPDELRALLKEHQPSLVYLDLQNSLSEIDVASVVEIVREISPRTRVHADVSHTLGLVLGGAHRNPLDDGADTMGGSTHKTFPGPQKGVLFTRDDELAEQIRQAQFEMISSHHFADTLALALAAVEFETFGVKYAAQVIHNARLLGSKLIDAGFDVVKGTPEITDCHQVWVACGSDFDAMDFADGLAEAGVRVNVSAELPRFDGRFALRLGLSEITFEGGHDHSVAQLADIFAMVRGGRIQEARTLCASLRDGLGTPYYFREEDVAGASV
ncbi:DegT/DnrJ/EryC1/StrS family aminotransferase [Nonomuraea sp. NPDC049400]|uniref:DegT/DnrJ/EryC1/StrS family aminotransferase n=1 Tax=Nonomuraea sp. NPDC049400 TaxID=3364352 RepID=UPI00378B9FA4